MAKRMLPAEGTLEWDRLVRRYKNPMTNLVRLSKELGYTSTGSLMNAMSRVGVLRGVPKSARPRYDNPPMVSGNCLITADEQMPYHDAEFLNRVLELAYAWGVTQAVSAGDTINGTAFSYFMNKPEERSWHDEAKAANNCLVAMADAVPHWLLLKGNHTANIIKATSEQLDMTDVLKLLDSPDRVKVTEYYFCIVNGDWRVSHPRNISVIHGRVPSMLCDKFEMNVAAAHGHLVGIYPAKSGRLIAVDTGICADPMRLDYYAERDSTRPAMNQGALILKQSSDGRYRPHLLSPLWTDWVAMRRMYKREI
jgi:hypothetical protein